VNKDQTEFQTEFQTAGGRSTSEKLSLQATTPPADVPGYRLTEFLGAGAFGQVWIGRDLNTGRNVAVKFYLHRGGVNWSLLSREVKNLVQLSADRYVVQVLEVGWDADPPYYVMELVNGGSLEDQLQTRGRIPVDEAVEIFRKICIGLNRCHAKGVLHCDIKPANILMGDDDEPRLADFGQSRLSHDQTPALGTLFYMAPEQADLNSTPDASWDVYAVGAIIFRMLDGKPPYRDETVVQQLDSAGSLQERLDHYRAAIASSPPPEQHLQRVGVDRALGRIVSKCLAVNPKVRYANVQQILQDLNRRDLNRQARPLMLLGIVGPLLVLLATTFFGARTIQEAEDFTKAALRGAANGTNQLLATFAARSLEGEFEQYFRLTRDEASRPEFIDQLKKTLQDKKVAQTLGEIAAMGTPQATHNHTDARERLLDNPERIRLLAELDKRLGRYTSSDPRSRRPRLATMFVTDAAGTIISIAYDQKIERDENSAGKNYSYRTYYHGGRVDLPKETTEIGQLKPLTSTHLSAAFPSTATRLWKVAVSTPIYFSEDHSSPDAMFVVTINLGDIEVPQSKQRANQIAVLVEAREGPEQGTILQHPLMDARRKAGVKLEGAKYQVPAELMQELLKGGDATYRDPLAKASDGSRYGGPWLAAIEPVTVPEDRFEIDDKDGFSILAKDNSELLVLVQYRLETVNEPVEQMKSALMWSGAAAIASILVITLTLWVFVRRVGSSTNRDRESDNHAAVRGSAETIPVR
jgi:serine/threonine protein kinase